MDNQPKLTYTEVLQMLDGKLDRFEAKIDKMDEKLDCIATRTTVLETKAASNKGWGMWLWGAVITAVNLAFSYYSR